MKTQTKIHNKEQAIIKIMEGNYRNPLQMVGLLEYQIDQLDEKQSIGFNY